MPETDTGRWQRLFADFEAEAAALERADLAAETSDRVRSEMAAIRLCDRLRAAVGHSLVVTVVGAGRVTGDLREVGPDWLLLAESYGREDLVPTAAVTSIEGLGRHSAAPGSEGVVERRLTLRWALKRIVRDRAAMAIVLVDGHRYVGTADRVGADFIEMAEHPTGEARRPRAVRTVRTVPLAAIALLRSV